MNRIILHSDCNKFYASVEALYHPELKNTPFVVGGDPKNRHGIVLTKNEEAEKYGICTGEPLWRSFQKCPSLKIIQPDFKRYKKCSDSVYSVYSRYTDKIESFGLDEAWLDVTESKNLFGSGEEIATSIKEAIKNEIGITVSIGVSFNKIFAKLGSDYKKPDAITVFSKENYREKVWPLPVSSMLFVGKYSSKKLNDCFIHTIGDAASSNPKYLESLLGKQGKQIYQYANGLDTTPVLKADHQNDIKSISNSTTAPKDMETDDEVKQYLYFLSENISKRLGKRSFKAKTISLSVRNTNLQTSTKQIHLKNYTSLACDIAEQSFILFKKYYSSSLPIRSIGISVTDFGEDCEQFDFLNDDNKEKLYIKENTVNELKKRFGDDCIHHALIFENEAIRNTPNRCAFNHVNCF